MILWSFDPKLIKLKLGSKTQIYKAFFISASSSFTCQLKNVIEFMLCLQAYKEHLRSKTGQDECCVDATIELLSHTAKIIQLFHDKHAITTTTDSSKKFLSEIMV